LWPVALGVLGAGPVLEDVIERPSSGQYDLADLSTTHRSALEKRHRRCSRHSQEDRDDDLDIGTDSGEALGMMRL